MRIEFLAMDSGPGSEDIEGIPTKESQLLG